MCMPDSSIPSDEALLAELQALERLLENVEKQNAVAVMVRLIRDGAPWPDLLRENNLDQWLVLPLGEDKFPALCQLKKQLVALNFQKDHDALTDLCNRRAFDQALALETERAERMQTPLSLCIIDMDNFKAINDAHGHPCGDKVLKAMGTILRSETRKIDIAARIGGEEFALILPGTGLMRAQKLLARILAAVRAARVDFGVTTLGFTCSMGVSSYRGLHVPGVARLISEADKALYRAKSGGKNRLESALIMNTQTTLKPTLVHQDEKRFLFSSFFAPVTSDPADHSQGQP